jgi:hypothetical protein
METEQMTECLLARMNANAKANQEELLARMDAYHEKRMAKFDAYEKRMVACLGQTEANIEKIEQDPGMMQSVEEHQDVPSEDVVVRQVRGLWKRRSVRKLAAERRQKPQEGTRGYCGSRRRVTVAGKRTSRHATVAWRRRKLLRKSGTQDTCGPPKNFAAAGMRKG